jgi:uncharacterized protein (DUF302 family)
MQENQTIGLDLPLKVVSWQDAEGNAWVSYNDPAWLASRHGLGELAAEPVRALAAALALFVEGATVP